MKSQPFFFLFQTSIGKYLYDVNMNKILKLPEKVADSLHREDEIQYIDDADVRSYIDNIKKIGFLKENRVEISKHPDTEYLAYYADRGIENLILQVTQNCNLRCKYCVYSEGSGYKNRNHANRKMTWDIAKKAMDFYISHSVDVETLYVSFYGGEPLLEYKFIEKCMNYMHENSFHKRVSFNITTNGTLLSDEIMKILVKYQVTLIISFDGPEEIQNSGRVFQNSNIGSFQCILKNMRCFQEKYNDYWKKYVSINTVLYAGAGFRMIYDFFKDQELFDGMRIVMNFPSTTYNDSPKIMEEQYYNEWYYYNFILFLYKIRWFKHLKPYICSPLDIKRIGFFENLPVTVSQKLAVQNHHGGPCIPGIFRLFVNVEGKFYPCERVSECSDASCIGSLETGLDLQRMEICLNIERLSEELCHKCWAYRFCNVCVAKVDDLGKLSSRNLLKQCQSVRHAAETTLKEYVVLKELGYDTDAESLLED